MKSEWMAQWLSRRLSITRSLVRAPILTSLLHEYSSSRNWTPTIPKSCRNSFRVSLIISALRKVCRKFLQRFVQSCRKFRIWAGSPKFRQTGISYNVSDEMYFGMPKIISALPKLTKEYHPRCNRGIWRNIASCNCIRCLSESPVLGIIRWEVHEEFISKVNSYSLPVKVGGMEWWVIYITLFFNNHVCPTSGLRPLWVA